MITRDSSALGRVHVFGFPFSGGGEESCSRVPGRRRPHKVSHCSLCPSSLSCTQLSSFFGQNLFLGSRGIALVIGTAVGEQRSLDPLSISRCSVCSASLDKAYPDRLTSGLHHQRRVRLRDPGLQNPIQALRLEGLDLLPHNLDPVAFLPD